MAHILGNCCIRYQCAFLLYLSLVKSLFCFPTLQRGNKIGLLTVTSSNHMSTPSLQLLVFFYSSPPFCLFCVSASLVSNMSAVMRSEDSGEQNCPHWNTRRKQTSNDQCSTHTHPDCCFQWKLLSDRRVIAITVWGKTASDWQNAFVPRFTNTVNIGKNPFFFSLYSITTCEKITFLLFLPLFVP